MVALVRVRVSGFWKFIEDFFGVPEEEWGNEEFEKIKIEPPTKKVNTETVDPQEILSGKPQPSTSAPKTSRTSTPTPIAMLGKAILMFPTTNRPLHDMGIT